MHDHSHAPAQHSVQHGIRHAACTQTPHLARSGGVLAGALDGGALRAGVARRPCVLVAAAALLLLCPVACAVELPALFTDGMVLQRDQPIPVWGRAAPGARVQVSLGDAQAQATAAADGGWRVTLPARAGSDAALVMRIDDGSAPRTLRDVLIGDVWLASGQSNMEFPLTGASNAQQAIASATDPRIRHFKVPKAWSGTPQWQLPGGSWVPASPQTAGAFSAVAYLFARELHTRTGVPIGIIDSTWGGSSIEAWTDAATQGMRAADAAALAARVASDDQRARDATLASLRRWRLPADDARWASPDLDARDWVPMPVPALWESQGYAGMDGIAWYRSTVTLSEADAKAGVTLGLGRIDDSDTTWVNGVQVGSTRQQYNLPRAYAVPPSALHAGVNQIAVRVEDTGGGGGLYGPDDERFVQPAGGARRALRGPWLFHVARATVNIDDGKNQQPTLLYNAMIHPLQPYALRGVIWYQGEANTKTLADAQRYRAQFAAMITQWRAQFAPTTPSPTAAPLPFAWVQLASFGSNADVRAPGAAPSDPPQTSPWALLRESQSATLALPATGQAVTIDVGAVDDIHPTNKRDVAARLALVARRVAYGETVIDSGPVFAGLQIDGALVRARMDTRGSALAARGGGTALQGFALAGADRVFHPASARIDGDAVLVHSDAVPAPVAVRYAWRDAPIDANLVNGDGLPASPFRSDAW